MWSVYVLKCSDGHSYVGCTENIEDRMSRHRQGHVPATASRLPAELITTINFENKYKAFAFEKYLKSGSGRAFMKKHFT